MNDEYKYIIEAAREGGAIAKKYFGKELEIQVKTIASDVRTQADTEAEAAIITVLTKHFPEYNIYGEESGKTDNRSEYTFVIDPIDGTNNFVLGVPLFTTAIALQKNNQTIFGVIYHPITDQLYYAKKGAGAWLNDQQLHVSDESNISKSTVAYACAYGTPLDFEAARSSSLITFDFKRVTFSWCPTADLTFLASGKIEAIVVDRAELYDVAAGKLIAQEAGARVTRMDGTPDDDMNTDFIATNGRIHISLVDRLLSAYAPR